MLEWGVVHQAGPQGSLAQSQPPTSDGKTGFDRRLQKGILSAHTRVAQGPEPKPKEEEPPSLRSVGNRTCSASPSTGVDS